MERKCGVCGGSGILWRYPTDIEIKCWQCLGKGSVNDANDQGETNG